MFVGLGQKAKHVAVCLAVEVEPFTRKGCGICDEEAPEFCAEKAGLKGREQAIHAEIAYDVQARTIVEGANGPTTPEADEILNDRGIVVVPDIL